MGLAATDTSTKLVVGLFAEGSSSAKTKGADTASKRMIDRTARMGDKNILSKLPKGEQGFFKNKCNVSLTKLP